MMICNVCSDPTPKYRCPACQIRYCRRVEQPPPITPEPKTEELWNVDDILFKEEDYIDKVPFQKLQLLSRSEELRGLLRNPHLRQLLRSIDAADSKADAMRSAMQEPLFVEFSDQCLKVVENDRPGATEEV
ncbi:hypothetical protein NHX12_009648 [Muraenolepis orangiensis]|uniref:Zinc finger HIT domain-containing protein 3 n=1 Tax=Muraenolepis orangiensis TaxID=630683 RepID=A0A9Q0DI21_9TELE|nr:hypothetical protein NHX12_009648 [Muraenolepis orangiensis]